MLQILVSSWVRCGAWKLHGQGRCSMLNSKAVQGGKLQQTELCCATPRY